MTRKPNRGIKSKTARAITPVRVRAHPGAGGGDMPGKKDKGAKKVVALAAELAVAGMTGRIWEVKDAEEIVEFCVTLAEGILDSLEGDD